MQFGQGDYSDTVKVIEDPTSLANFSIRWVQVSGLLAKITGPCCQIENLLFSLANRKVLLHEGLSQNLLEPILQYLSYLLGEIAAFPCFPWNMITLDATDDTGCL